MKTPRQRAVEKVAHAVVEAGTSEPEDIEAFCRQFAAKYYTQVRPIAATGFVCDVLARCAILETN